MDLWMILPLQKKPYKLDSRGENDLLCQKISLKTDCSKEKCILVWSKIIEMRSSTEEISGFESKIIERRRLLKWALAEKSLTLTLCETLESTIGQKKSPIITLKARSWSLGEN